MYRMRPLSSFLAVQDLSSNAKQISSASRDALAMGQLSSLHSNHDSVIPMLRIDLTSRSLSIAVLQQHDSLARGSSRVSSLWSESVVKALLR